MLIFACLCKSNVNIFIFIEKYDRQFCRRPSGICCRINTTYSSIGNMIGPLFAGLLFDKHLHIPYIVGALILGLALFRTMQKNHVKEQVISYD